MCGQHPKPRHRSPKTTPKPGVTQPPRCPVKAGHVAAGALGTSDSAGRACRGGASAPPPEDLPSSPCPAEAPPTTGRAHPPEKQMQASPHPPLPPGTGWLWPSGFWLLTHSSLCGWGVMRGEGSPVPSPRMEEQAGLQPRTTTWCGASALLSPFLSEWVAVSTWQGWKGERWRK